MTSLENNNTFEVSNINQESGKQTEEMVTIGGMECHLPVLEDVDHPLVPDFEHEYILREMGGGVTDVEEVSFMIEDNDFASLIIGEAGVGKDACYKALFANANWPMVRMSVGSGVTYEQLIGRFIPADGSDQEDEIIRRAKAVSRTAERLQNQNKEMERSEAIMMAKDLLPDSALFTFQPGLLYQAFKHGWAFVVDELNAMDEEQSLALNQAAESRDSRELTIFETSEVLKPHENFRFCATMNPPTYAGTNELNSAFKSRFYPTEFDYLPKKGELVILQERTNIIENEGKEPTENLIYLANDIRMQEQSGNDIITKISTRDLLKVARLTEIKSIRDACKTVFLGIADETDKESIRETINTQNF